MSLFDNNGAVFSDDRKYRYALFRLWDIKKPSIMFIGLNPSTANEVDNDPTIRRVIRFAFDWDYGCVYMMNLFGFVTPYPKDLINCSDPIGENDKWLEKVFDKCEDVVFAWGSFPEAADRAKKVITMFPNAKALWINKDGSPKHPLYCHSNLKPIPYL